MAKYIDLEANVTVSLSAEIAGKKPRNQLVTSNVESIVVDKKEDKDLKKNE